MKANMSFINPTSINKVFTDLNFTTTPETSIPTSTSTSTPTTNINKRKSLSQNIQASMLQMPNYAPRCKRKRYTWSDELHKKFMSCIFDIGLQHAKPKALLSIIQPAPVGLTTEHIKSHLQKYRKNSKTSKNLFLKQYEASCLKYKSSYEGKALNPAHHAYPFSFEQDEIDFEKVFESIESVDSGGKAIVVGDENLLEQTKHLGPGRLVFIPNSKPKVSAKDKEREAIKSVKDQVIKQSEIQIEKTNMFGKIGLELDLKEPCIDVQFLEPFEGCDSFLDFFKNADGHDCFL